MKKLLRLVFLCTLALSSCALDHVRGLRDAQDRFSEITAAVNQSTLAQVQPRTTANSGDKWKQELDSNQDATRTLERATSELLEQQALVEYAAIAEAMAELNKKSAQELKADRLYGVSMTLQVLAEWKRAFYEHLLRFDEPVAGSDTDALAESRSLASVRALAEETLAALAGEPLYPRDRFLLNAIRPLVRYDIAYLWAVRHERDGNIAIPSTPASRKTTCKHVRAVVEQMAKAEQELAGVDLGDNAEHLRSYVVLARFAMLRMAMVLVQKSEVNQVDKTDGTGTQIFDWGQAEALAVLPQLYARMAKFREESTTASNPVNAVLTHSGLTPADLGHFYVSEPASPAWIDQVPVQDGELDQGSFTNALRQQILTSLCAP